MARTNEQAAALTEQYNERYLSKAEVASYVLDRNAELKDKDKLQELADVLQVQYLYVFDGEGVLESTNSSYTNFVLSEDPAEQSYEFRKLLQGVDFVIQEPQPDEVSGDLRQYIGVTLHDAQGNADGFVQLGIRPQRLATLLESVQIDSILDGVKIGAEGFGLRGGQDGRHLRLSSERRAGGPCGHELRHDRRAAEERLQRLSDVDGKTYYASSFETDDYYVYVAQPEGELMTERVPLTVATGVSGLVCQIIVFLLVAFEVRPRGRAVADAAALGGTSGDGEGKRVVDVTMPDGRTAKTESAASRWIYRSLGWGDKTAEQRVLTVIKVLVSIFALAVCVAVLFKDAVFPPDSVFTHILGGNWERGLNVFAITACLMIACVVMVITMLVQQLLRLLASVFGARGETMCRLFSSFIKYVSIIGMVYYCLMVIGIDTTTLLASRGILSIAISFGAKDLVGDLISGLFIIFEGDFRVGDIIQVGGARHGGGDRRAHHEDQRRLGQHHHPAQQRGERCGEHDQGAVVRHLRSGHRVRANRSSAWRTSWRRSSPTSAAVWPAIEDGPFYKGIVALADNSVNIRIVAQCLEKNRGQLGARPAPRDEAHLRRVRHLHPVPAGGGEPAEGVLGSDARRADAGRPLQRAAEGGLARHRQRGGGRALRSLRLQA